MTGRCKQLKDAKTILWSQTNAWDQAAHERRATLLAGRKIDHLLFQPCSFFLRRTYPAKNMAMSPTGARSCQASRLFVFRQRRKKDAA